jgi:hypothetical protein
MRSSVWGSPNNLRNQSDRSTPSRSGVWVNGVRGPAFGVDRGRAGYVNAPTRGNSTRSTITANKPGAMTPGGQGVDVKHGSYARYLAKKKGNLLNVYTATANPNGGTPIAFLSPLRQNPNGFNDPNTNGRTFNSAGMNNMTYKFSLVSNSRHSMAGKITCDTPTCGEHCPACPSTQWWRPSRGVIENV